MELSFGQVGGHANPAMWNISDPLARSSPFQTSGIALVGMVGSGAEGLEGQNMARKGWWPWPRGRQWSIALTLTQSRG